MHRAVLLAAVLAALGLTACDPGAAPNAQSSDSVSVGTSTSTSTDAAPISPQISLAPAPTAPTTPPLPPGEQQALAKAQDYLNYAAFSQSGLAKQLEFDGFSTADAEFAAANVGADWNAQAAAKAKDYLGYSHFSHSGLVAQLEFDGFTPAQAEAGTSAAGL